jgi:hypothetical protein
MGRDWQTTNALERDNRPLKHLGLHIHHRSVSPLPVPTAPNPVPADTQVNLIIPTSIVLVSDWPLTYSTSQACAMVSSRSSTKRCQRCLPPPPNQGDQLWIVGLFLMEID